MHSTHPVINDPQLIIMTLKCHDIFNNSAGLKPQLLQLRDLNYNCLFCLLLFVEVITVHITGITLIADVLAGNHTLGLTTVNTVLGIGKPSQRVVRLISQFAAGASWSYLCVHLRSP